MISFRISMNSLGLSRTDAVSIRFCVSFLLAIQSVQVISFWYRLKDTVRLDNKQYNPFTNFRCVFPVQTHHKMVAKEARYRHQTARKAHQSKLNNRIGTIFVLFCVKVLKWLHSAVAWTIPPSNRCSSVVCVFLTVEVSKQLHPAKAISCERTWDLLVLYLRTLVVYFQSKHIENPAACGNCC